MESEGSTATKLDVGVLCSNVVSTIGIVLANKVIFNHFPYPMALTCSHQIVAGVILTLQQGAFQPKRSMPLWANAWTASLCLATIYLQNMSLLMNTVTLYQLCKMLVIPTQCLWQYLTKGTILSRHVYGSLLVLTVGVGISTVAELSFSATIAGLCVAVSGVIVIVIEQAEVQRLKAMFEIDSMDFVLSNIFHRIFGSALLILLIERDALTAMTTMTGYECMMWIITCLCATCINITSVFIIGKFGSVAIAVVGHLKTVGIIGLGFMLHTPPFDMSLAKNVTGIAVALSGAGKYAQYTLFSDSDCSTWFALSNLEEASKKKPAAAEEELDPLTGMAEDAEASHEEMPKTTKLGEPSVDVVGKSTHMVDLEATSKEKTAAAE